MLGVGLLVALILLLLLTLRPSNGQMTLAIGEPHAEECPVGSGAPACFRFDVTNTGQADGVATCFAMAATGTEAVFANGADSVGVRLGGGEVKGVYVKVTTLGSDEVLAPALRCDA